jgi:glycosyltransferase involved in cell wall biosynthesis
MPSDTAPVPKSRVAFILPLLRGRGGWPTFARGAVGALARYVDPVLIVGEADEPAARNSFPTMEIHMLPVIQPDNWGDSSASLLRRFLPALFAVQRVPKLRVDIVHSFEMFPAGWLGVEFAKRERAPLVLTAHGTYAIVWISWSLLDILYRSVLRAASAICPVSHGTEARLRYYYSQSIAHTAVHVIANGTDAAKRIARADVETRHWPADPMVLSVGGVKPRKGHATSLRAFSILQEQFPQARYSIAGREPATEYRRELEGIIQQENIRNVEFLGVVDDATLDRLYRESSMFVLLAQEEEKHFEGFGLAYLEAGAYGLPVIGTTTGGIPDAVKDGETGILVPPTDPAVAGEAMIRLAKDPSLSRKIGLAGRAWAEELTWDRFARLQMDIYKEIGRGATLPAQGPEQK